MKTNFKKLLFFVIIIAVIIAAVFLIKPALQQTNPDVSPSPVPTGMPDVTEETPVLSRADEILSEMTLREKLYQMFIVTPDMLAGETGVQSMTPALKEGLETFPVGGIIYMGENVSTANQVKTLIAEMSEISEIPMFVLWIRKVEELQGLKKMSAFLYLKICMNIKIWERIRHMKMLKQ